MTSQEKSEPSQLNKILLLSDLHFGARSDNQHFLRYQKYFFSEILIPFLIENNINTVIQLGDIFDRRKFINFYTLHEVFCFFFDALEKHDIEMVTILGNHDIYYRNTLDVNSPELLLEKYKNIRIIKEPEEFIYEDLSFLLVPWICDANYNEVHQKIKETKAEFLVGHFEFAGFEMQRGVVNNSGEEVDPIFSKFSMVFSGHYHHSSKKGNVYYLGTPYEITWSDYDDHKGFYTLSTNRELEFLPNTSPLFYKVEYDDTNWSLKTLNNFNFSIYKNKYCKIIVKKKNNKALFNLFLTKMQEAEPIECSVVEESVLLINEDTKISEAEDTLTIVNKVIDSISDIEYNEKMKNMMFELYQEAISRE